MVNITKNGETVFAKGLGYSDVENLVRANPHTVARIASISKPISCLMAAKLYEEKKLDLDLPIDNYLPDLPKFKFNDKEVKITTRQLISHTSGIRHYDKVNNKSKENDKKDEKKNDNTPQKDTAFQEFYMKDNFKTTKDALQIFVNDELFYEPGANIKIFLFL
jgi:serine beta-lactamase-like protein LACTB